MASCILIPAYNAESTIADVIREAFAFGFPVIVVDDGSTDATAAEVAHFPVNIIRHPSNRGKGAALKTGFAWALQHGFVGVVTIDADGQHEISAIPSVLSAARAKGADIVIASRRTQFEGMAWLRRSWNRFGAWSMHKLTGFDIPDSQSGFRWYSSRLLRGVELSTDGYHLEMEILLKAWKAGFSVASLPVPARIIDGRRTSHFKPVRDTWKICMTFLKYVR